MPNRRGWSGEARDIRISAHIGCQSTRRTGIPGVCRDEIEGRFELSLGAGYCRGVLWIQRGKSQAVRRRQLDAPKLIQRAALESFKVPIQAGDWL